MSTPSVVIVLDDSEESRAVIARFIEHGGWPTKQAATVEGATGILDAVPDGTRCLVVLPSFFAAEHTLTFLRHARRPQLLMTCVRPPSCPIAPETQCANLRCLQKPNDFRHPSILISRVRALLS